MSQPKECVHQPDAWKRPLAGQKTEDGQEQLHPCLISRGASLPLSATGSLSESPLPEHHLPAPLPVLSTIICHKTIREIKEDAVRRPKGKGKSHRGKEIPQQPRVALTARSFQKA